MGPDRARTARLRRPCRGVRELGRSDSRRLSGTWVATASRYARPIYVPLRRAFDGHLIADGDFLVYFFCQRVFQSGHEIAGVYG